MEIEAANDEVDLSLQDKLRHFVKNNVGGFDWDVFCYHRSTSTMDLASRYLRDINKVRSRDNRAATVRPAVFFSSVQTNGHGREGREWQSQEGGIYCTFLFTEDEVSKSIFQRSINGLSLAVGLSIVETLSTFGVSSGLKWPNDVLVKTASTQDFKKIAGVLVDSVFRGSDVRSISVGIGLNVNQSCFPPEIGASSASMVLDNELDFEKVCFSLITNVEKMWREFANSGLAGFLELLNQLHLLNDRLVTVEDLNGVKDNRSESDFYQARILRISDDASLVVEEQGAKQPRKLFNARIHLNTE
jgi:BirA family biotin operon repressor/biotin-[acetyl-CoA-carboxylase] ligase